MNDTTFHVKVVPDTISVTSVGIGMPAKELPYPILKHLLAENTLSFFRNCIWEIKQRFFHLTVLSKVSKTVSKIRKVSKKVSKKVGKVRKSKNK